MPEAPKEKTEKSRLSTSNVKLKLRSMLPTMPNPKLKPLAPLMLRRKERVAREQQFQERSKIGPHTKDSSSKSVPSPVAVSSTSASSHQTVSSHTAPPGPAPRIVPKVPPISPLPKFASPVPRHAIKNLHAEMVFEQNRAKRLSEFEAQLDAIARQQADIRVTATQTLNALDRSIVKMNFHIRALEEINVLLRTQSMSVDNAEEAADKFHMQQIRDAYEEIDRIRDQCKDIREQVTKQRGDMALMGMINPGRTLYVVIEFVIYCFVWLAVTVVWLVRTCLCLPTSATTESALLQWPATIGNLRLKSALVIPSMKSISLRRVSKSRRHYHGSGEIKNSEYFALPPSSN